MRLGWNNLKPKSQYKIITTSFLTLGILQNHVKGCIFIYFLKLNSLCVFKTWSLNYAIIPLSQIDVCTWGAVLLVFVKPQLWNFLLVGHLSMQLKLFIVCKKRWFHGIVNLMYFGPCNLGYVYFFFDIEE